MTHLIFGLLLLHAVKSQHSSYLNLKCVQQPVLCIIRWLLACLLFCPVLGFRCKLCSDTSSGTSVPRCANMEHDCSVNKWMLLCIATSSSPSVLSSRAAHLFRKQWTGLVGRRSWLYCAKCYTDGRTKERTKRNKGLCHAHPHLCSFFSSSVSVILSAVQS